MPLSNQFITDLSYGDQRKAVLVMYTAKHPQFSVRCVNVFVKCIGIVGLINTV